MPGQSEAMPRSTSVRTFSQLHTASPFVPSARSPHAYASASVGALLHAPFPPAAADHGNHSWADYSRAAPVSAVDAQAAEGLLQRPLGPDAIREAVYAYLEVTNRHDVVVAMLADERRHAQRNGARADGAAAATSPPATPRQERGPLSAGPGAFASPVAEGKRGRQRRAHDLLRKGLLDRLSNLKEDEESRASGGSPQPQRTASLAGTALRHHPPRRGRGHTGSPELVSPASRAPQFVPGSPTRTAASSSAAGAATVPGKPAATQRQHLPRVLPTLYGLEEAVRPHLTLLFIDLETKLTAQYRQQRLLPPSHEVLQYVLTQSYEPMWSAGEDGNAFHLFPPTNPVTGVVLYGTLNQLVEQLTCVHIMPVSTPADGLVKNTANFTHAFLRQHRLVMPSQVLLAKLMERYLVPLSLRLGFERFRVHGITVHAPGLGASLPKRRSQSETVRHGRRHPGAPPAAASAAPAATVTGAGSAALTSEGSRELSGGSARLWGSRSARLSSPNRDTQPAAMDRTVSAAVEEYIRATAAATTPELALASLGRSGIFTSASTDSLAALAHSAAGAAAASLAETGQGGAGGGAVAGAPARAPVEVISTYSPSAALWLTVCERVQTKVLAVLLFWLQQHPYHFDAQMVRCILHFVESCCYVPSMWADAPSRAPQMAEFIRRECNRVITHASRRRATEDPRSGSAPLPRPSAGFPFLAEEWLHGVLQDVYEPRRHHLLWHAVPPSLRVSLPTSSLPWTWRTPMQSLRPSEYLPCFAFRTPPSVDAVMTDIDASAATFTAAAGSGGGAARLHALAVTALAAFADHTFETYVRGLTAAHYRLFTSFPAQDIHIAAHRTGAAYLASATFQSSFLARFLNSSVLLTSWSVSLLLHAAYLDGEKAAAAAAAAAAVTNLSILNSFVADVAGYRAHSNRDAGLGAGAARVLQHNIASSGGDSVDGRSHSSSMSLGDSSATSASVATVSVAGASQAEERRRRGEQPNNSMATGGGVGAAGFGTSPLMHQDAGRRGAYTPNPARQLLQMLDRLVDLVIGFLRVNNLHASFSVFRGLQHPFVQRLLGHPKVAPHVHVQTAHRIRKLAGLLASTVPGSGGPPGEGGGGTTKANGPQGGSSPNRDGSETGAGAAATATAGASVQSAAATAAAAAGGSASIGKTTSDGAGTTSTAADGAAAARRARKAGHTFFEYLHTVPDSVEYPTVPVVQYYLRELQHVFATEPTILTVPTHRMQSHFVAEEVRLFGSFALPCHVLAQQAEEQEEDPAAFTPGSPIAVVNWRKLHLVDDWLQRVHGHQQSCLHYAAAKSTVVRHIAPDLDFERAFDAQLDKVLVTDVVVQRQMANQLYTAL